MSASWFSSLLERLMEGECRFILVGGLSAVLQGAPVHTYDVDIVYANDAENLRRLLDVLERLDAIFRIQPERKLRPALSHLEGSGHLNLVTSLGPLDLLSFIGGNLTYDDLLLDSSRLAIRPGVEIQVLNLQKLISLKEELGGEKDLAMLPTLRRTLLEKSK